MLRAAPRGSPRRRARRDAPREPGAARRLHGRGARRRRGARGTCGARAPPPARARRPGSAGAAAPRHPLRHLPDRTIVEATNGREGRAMTGTRTYPEGVPSWIDIEQADLAAAQEFYGGLFGWTFEAAPGPDPRAAYVIARLDGREAAGLGAARDAGAAARADADLEHLRGRGRRRRRRPTHRRGRRADRHGARRRRRRGSCRRRSPTPPVPRSGSGRPGGDPACRR